MYQEKDPNHYVTKTGAQVMVSFGDSKQAPAAEEEEVTPYVPEYKKMRSSQPPAQKNAFDLQEGSMMSDFSCNDREDTLREQTRRPEQAQTDPLAFHHAQEPIDLSDSKITGFSVTNEPIEYNIANPVDESPGMRDTISPGDEIRITASGAYNIEDAIYENEEYPEDFESDEEAQQEAEQDPNELTQIMQNYQTMLDSPADENTTLDVDTSVGIEEQALSTFNNSGSQKSEIRNALGDQLYNEVSTLLRKNRKKGIDEMETQKMVRKIVKGDKIKQDLCFQLDLIIYKEFF